MAKILHITSENFAGVPSALVKAERLIGLESDIIAILDTGRGHPCENVLNLPFSKGFLPGILRYMTGSTRTFGNTRYKGIERPPVWRPKIWGKLLFCLRDALWKTILIRKHIVEKLLRYDIIVLDGGVGFQRNRNFLLGTEKSKDRIVSIFYGDDLRRRGVIPDVERNSKLVFTFEFDHTLIHPRAKFLFYPFFIEEMPPKCKIDDGKIRIGHSPTRRASKGTDVILSVLSRIKKDFKNVEIVLIEKMSYKDALLKKSELDIFIDQLGELGYGISGLEAMAIGIPVVVQLMPDFDRFLGKHPFVLADKDTLEKELKKLITDKERRTEMGKMGIEWVKDVHDPIKCANTIANEYQKLSWI